MTPAGGARTRRAGHAYLALVLAFVLAPAAFVLADSFNAAASFPSVWEGATLRWYKDIARHPEFPEAAWLSLQLALAAAAIAAVTGFMAAYALALGALPGRDLVATALTGPLLVPELVTGLAILQLAGLLGLPLGLPLLTAAHALLGMPLVLRTVLAGFSRFDFALEDAARDLGANRWQTVRHVTLPLLAPSALAGFVLAAVLSFVNLPLSMFLTTARTATLPVIAFAYMESRLDPTIAAVATLVMIAAAALTVLIDRLTRGKR